MKIALLTTDTTHHRYFAWKLQERFALNLVVLESCAVNTPFSTHHTFEDERDEYERNELNNGGPELFDELCETCQFETVNHPEALSLIRQFQIEVALVFGTGKLRPDAINAFSRACLNLHGGNPEEYRGLDTHLWAIYHGDFANLITTLHVVAPDLDTGDIVGQQRLPLTPDTQLMQLRAINTRVCVELCMDALSRLGSRQGLNARKQARRGRYYSFMPAALKEECRKKFDRHISRL